MEKLGNILIDKSENITPLKNSLLRKKSTFFQSFSKFIDKEIKSNPIILIRNHFEQFTNDLKENFNKGKFRKILLEILEKEKLFIECEDNWRIQEIKIKCMMKIISKKFIKYSNQHKIKGLEGWLRRIDDEIIKWLEMISKYENQNKELAMIQLEICIKFVLEHCYNFSMQQKNLNQVADCAAILGLAERLLRISSQFTSDPESLNISQKVLLFISSLLIADKDFESAKNYQADSLKLSFRELNFRMGIKNGIDLKNLTKIEQFHLEKVFLNIVIAFYQMGVSDENLGSITKAIEAYKESKWFAMNFLKSTIPELTQFIFDVENRAINYNKIIQNIKNSHKILKVENEKKENKNKNKNKKSQLFYDELNTKKFDDIKKFVENLKFDDIEQDDMKDGTSNNIKNILSTVNLIDNLMSDKFKNIINDMDKVEVNNLDKESKQKIQKKLKEIKSDVNYKEKENLRKSLNSAKINKNLAVNSIVSNFYKTTQATTSSNFDSERNLNNKDIEFKNEKNLNLINNNRPQTCKSTLKLYNPNGNVEKFNYSQFVFNKNFRNKFDHLDKLCSREFDFQKKMLYLKKNEKIVIDDFDRQKTEESCEMFFKQVLSKKTSIFKDDDNQNKKKNNLTETIVKNERQKLKMETNVIKSLSSRAYQDYKTFRKGHKNSEYKLRKEFVTESSVIFPDSKTIEDVNRQHLIKLEVQIDEMQKFENELKKDLHPNKKIPQTLKKYSLYTLSDLNEKFMKI